MIGFIIGNSLVTAEDDNIMINTPFGRIKISVAELHKMTYRTRAKNELVEIQFERQNDDLNNYQITVKED